MKASAARDPQLPEIVSPNAMIFRIIGELVATRIRHRASLEVLLRDGEFTFEAYYDAYMKLHERDAAALFAHLALTEDSFNASFSQWQAEDRKRYGKPGPATKPKEAGKR